MKKILLLIIFLSSYSWSSDYKICTSTSTSSLESCVIGYMDRGYIPQGGITVAVTPNHKIDQTTYIGLKTFAQSLVRN